MERITRRIGESIDFVDGKGYATLPHKEGVKLLFEKLAEYEDIGIEPERLKEFLGNFGISIVMKNTKLMNELQENKEIISKMAKRLKAFEENTFNMNWIPASERLPEEYGCYMVAWRPIHSNTENNLKIAGVPYFYEILEFDPDDESLWISSIRQCKEYEILAWQPLPEPWMEGQ